MERVTGIGGFFFESPDPAALAAWYTEHLGVDPVPTGYDQQPWTQRAGATAFAPMSADDPTLAGRPFAINFRVDDLDAMVAQLRSAGIEVEVDATDYPIGRFATLADPDGNPIQLWEPAPVS
jgi:predicted enzyme related to lactoylglutathione lyase